MKHTCKKHLLRNTCDDEPAGHAYYSVMETINERYFFRLKLERMKSIRYEGRTQPLRYI